MTKAMKKEVKPKKDRTTMMLPNKSHIQLSRMVIKVRASGVSCFKQVLLAALIDHAHKNPGILKELSYKS